jgi:hypothetical protein
MMEELWNTESRKKPSDKGLFRHHSINSQPGKPDAVGQVK